MNGNGASFKRVDVHADCLTSGGESLHKACPTSHMWIEDQVARLCKYLDGGTHECRAKSRWIFVETMGEAAYRFKIACA
jgi:hypothetical protein